VRRKESILGKGRRIIKSSESKGMMKQVGSINS
jgi:hypothetical protein